MKQLIAFIKKETLHLLRDVSTLVVIIAIPIIQLVLFGFAITTEVKNVKVAVFDPSKDEMTREIIEKINSSDFFDIAEYITSPDDIETVFQKDVRMNLVMVFSENFESSLLHTGEASIQLLADASDPNQGTTYTNYIKAIIGDYQQGMIDSKGLLMKPMQINTETRMLYNPHIKSSYNFVPGVMGMILMLICAMMTSISIVREKEIGTMEVLLASPIKPINVLLSKMTPYLVLSLINLTIIILLSYTLLDVPIQGNLLSLYAVSLLFIFVALLIGIFVSNVVKTQVAAIVICGMGMILPVMLLSGMIFPIESMPKVLQWLSNIVPAKWYIISIKKIMIQGLPIISTIKEIVIMVAMGLLLLYASMKTFKQRLE